MNATASTFFDSMHRSLHPSLHQSLHPEGMRILYVSKIRELAAYRKLSATLTDHPQLASARCAEVAMELCGAAAAGISMLQSDGSARTLHWQTVLGTLAAYQGFETSRHASPCGRCLDVGRTVVVSRPDRPFIKYRPLRPVIAEVLITPLYDHSEQPIGTLWIARHDAGHFSAADASVLEKVAIQLMLAMRWGRVDSKHRDELAFKDAMILEVDHRAKNALHVAGNFLSVQSRQTESAEVRTQLQEAYRRVHVLGHLQELLYKGAQGNPGSRQIEMAGVLQAIGDAIRHSFTEMAERVKLRVSAERLMLSEDNAIPLALLTNELITNAYKHAFPNGASGEIVAILKCGRTADARDVITLQIADSGIGGRSQRAEGVGQRIVRSFASHLKGELLYSQSDDGSGTKVILTIRRNVDAAEPQLAAANQSASSERHGLSDPVHASAVLDINVYS